MTLDSDFLRSLLPSIGVSVGAAAWLTKALVTHELSKDLEKRKAELTQQLESEKARLEGAVKQQVETLLADRAADREYALEARKRLYAAIGPLRFLRPLTLTQLIERQVAFADFSVDSGAAELLCFKKAAFACFNGSSLVEGHPRVDWIDEKEHVFYDHLARAADSLIVAPTGQEGRCMRYAEFEAAIGTATGLAAVVPFGELLKDFTPKGKPLLWLRLVAYGSLCNDFINRVGASIGFENRPFDIGHLLTAANDATILAAIDGYTERCAAMARSTL